MDRVTNQDLKRNNWRWATIDELLEDDELIKTIDPTDREWIVNSSSGRLVPKSIVEQWLNSYERQLPYQDQSDSMRKNHLENWIIPTLENLSTNKNFTEKDANALLWGNSIPYSLAYPEPKNLPDDIKFILYNDILRRRELAYNKLPAEKAAVFNEALNRAKEKLSEDTYNYRDFPDNIFDSSKFASSTAVTWGTDVIKRETQKPIDTLLHEFTHVFNNDGIRPTPEQVEILKQAYGEDFNQAQQEAMGGDPAYGGTYDFSFEWDSTNTDTRKELFQNYINKKSALGQGPEVQNPIIKGTSIDIVGKALENSNGYGQTYINFLKRKYKNNPNMLKQKLENIKKAIMFVKNINTNKSNSTDAKNLT